MIIYNIISMSKNIITEGNMTLGSSVNKQMSSLHIMMCGRSIVAVDRNVTAAVETSLNADDEKGIKPSYHWGKEMLHLVESRNVVTTG